MTLYAFANALKMAFSQLWRNRTRTGLTSLGILIGVASVIVMVGVGQGATASIQEDLSSFGVNLLMVTPGRDEGPQRRTNARAFTMADVDAIRTEVAGIAGVTPTANASVTVVANGLSTDTGITGSSADYLVVTGRTLAAGRLFTASEERAGTAVCVIGPTVATALFGSRDPLGTEMRVGKVPCTTIGVLAPEGESMMGIDQDDLIVMPARTVQRRMTGRSDVDAISISAATAAGMPQVRADVDALLRHRRHVTSDATVDFTVRDTSEMAATLGNITGILTLFLAAVAGVSLLVGGIGIMNIMLVSVTERTKEIGIRMAIGALEADIRTQFLVEAAVLAGVGGVVGALLGVLGVWAAATGFGLPLVLNGWVIALSVLFSAAMGIGFGWVPARNAARLEPIDALRHA